MPLNKSQMQAVTHADGPCLVLAGPGSGKTLTIAKRIEFLVKKQKVDPGRILVVTFTKYAAQEMKARFLRIMGSKSSQVTFGTFHGIYYGILKWAYKIQPSNLLDEKGRRMLLEQILRNMENDSFSGENLDDSFFSDLIEEIGNVKNNRISVEDYQPKKMKKSDFKRLYQTYEKEKRTLKKIDFEDMLLYCYELFLKRPDYLRKWQEKFKYILIDEFQDVNQVQYDVIRLLAAPENNLFVVGDDDQSIYGFRGAKPGIMKEFVRDYRDARQILLNINYRSDANIVNGALRVIDHNHNRFEKEIIPSHPAEESVHVQEVKDPFDEAHYIMNRIKALVKEGENLENIAVIFRTTEDARIMSEQFSKYQIPYYMREKMFNIYDHFVGKDLISYLSIVNGSQERKYYLQVANRPNRYLSRVALSDPKISFEKLRIFYEDKEWMQDRIDQWEWDMKMMKKQTPYAAVQYIRKSMGYESYLREYASEQEIDHKKLESILNEIHESTKAFATVQEWLDFVRKHKERLEQMQENHQANIASKEGVRFLTIHGAKGLEFNHVFIIHAMDGSMPYKKAVLKEELEEERRLFYVAMTRAKKKLIISYPIEKNGKETKPSVFLQELFYSQIDKNDVE